MTVPYAVVIPVASTDLGFCFSVTAPARYFLERGVPVYLCVNGPGALMTCHAWANPQGKYPEANVVFGGNSPNPYPARNIGLSLAFAQGYEMVVLTDNDCLPMVDYHEQLMQAIDRNALYSGRILTEIPDTPTKHFDMLRAERFECYDGFRPPDLCVGANMVIGANIYKLNGPMRESRSGGDADYSLRLFRDHGVATIAKPRLVVKKIIHGMSLGGVLKKQALRGASDPLDSDQTMREIRADIADASTTLADRIRPTQNSPMTSKEYASTVDAIFDLIYKLGRLAGKVDVPSRSNRNAE